MLRIHFMQQWFNDSDAAMEEALHDMPLLRRFAGLDAGSDTLPDETTILNFRHLLQTHRLSARLFASQTVNTHKLRSTISATKRFAGLGSARIGTASLESGFFVVISAE